MDGCQLCDGGRQADQENLRWRFGKMNEKEEGSRAGGSGEEECGFLMCDVADQRCPGEGDARGAYQEMKERLENHLRLPSYPATAQPAVLWITTRLVILRRADAEGSRR